MLPLVFSPEGDMRSRVFRQLPNCRCITIWLHLRFQFGLQLTQIFVYNRLHPQHISLSLSSSSPSTYLCLLRLLLHLLLLRLLLLVLLLLAAFPLPFGQLTVPLLPFSGQHRPGHRLELQIGSRARVMSTPIVAPHKYRRLGPVTFRVVRLRFGTRTAVDGRTRTLWIGVGINVHVHRLGRKHGSVMPNTGTWWRQGQR